MFLLWIVNLANIFLAFSFHFGYIMAVIFFNISFHDDHKLGSCWAYLDTHAFTCSACKERADVLRLASQYTGIPLTDMNSLLERIVSDFCLPSEQFAQDGNQNFKGYTKID